MCVTCPSKKLMDGGSLVVNYLILTILRYVYPQLFKMEHYMPLKVVIPKGKQVAAVAALQAAGISSIEDWATSLEGMLMERKAYVKDVWTDYKEYSTTNGAYIFQMKFVGTEGQLFNVFHTPGLVDALIMVDPYVAEGCMMLAVPANTYMICYGGAGMEVYLPPLALATPRPTPPVPSAPARVVPPPSTPLPFMEPVARMPTVVEPVVEPVSTAPTNPAPVERVIDTEDSIFTLDVYVPFTNDLLVHSTKEELKDYAVSEWVQFYDDVALPIEKKSYNIKEEDNGVNLSATFRTHVDKYGDVFTEEAFGHLEEAVMYADTDIFYVEMPVKNPHDGKTYYVKNYSEFITVGPYFGWSFGGVEGGQVNPHIIEDVEAQKKVKPSIQEATLPVQETTVVSPQEAPSPAQEVPQLSPKEKVAQRVAEMEAEMKPLRQSVKDLKKQRANLNSRINEKEARIRAFEFACDELASLFGF